MRPVAHLLAAFSALFLSFALESCGSAYASNEAGEAVYEAVMNDDLDAARKLLAENPGARFRDEDGDTLLHIAVLYEDLEMVRQCVANGIDLNRENDAELKPLDYVLALMMTSEQTGANVRALERIGEHLESNGARSEAWEELRRVQREIQQDVLDSLNQPIGY